MTAVLDVAVSAFQSNPEVILGHSGDIPGPGCRHASLQVTAVLAVAVPVFPTQLYDCRRVVSWPPVCSSAAPGPATTGEYSLKNPGEKYEF